MADGAANALHHRAGDCLSKCAGPTDSSPLPPISIRSRSTSPLLDRLPGWRARSLRGTAKHTEVFSETPGLIGCNEPRLRVVEIEDCGGSVALFGHGLGTELVEPDTVAESTPIGESNLAI